MRKRLVGTMVAIAKKLKIYAFIRPVYRKIKSLFAGDMIGYLVVITGQACNLKCRDCGNFSPYASKENLFYDHAKIIQDIDRIIKARFYIGTLQIQGGEPFIYPPPTSISCWNMQLAIKKLRQYR